MERIPVSALIVTLNIFNSGRV